MLLRAAFMPTAAGEEKRAVCGRCRDFTLARPLRVQEIVSLAVRYPASRSLALRPAASLLNTPLYAGLSFSHGTGRNGYPL